MRLLATLNIAFAALVATGLAACSKKTDASMMPSRLAVRQPATTASYRVDGKLTTCKVVIYPPTAVYGGEQLLVRLFPPESNAAIGNEYLDLCFIKQPSEPSSAYKTNWVRYNSPTLPDGSMLLNNTVLTITEMNAGGFSGTASGIALFKNTAFSSISEAVFTNAQVQKRYY
jgi:hypothetical protein